MKTSRTGKILDKQIMMDVKCRACLATTEAKMYHSLFTIFPEYTKTSLTVLDLLGIVTSTKVDMLYNLPNKICTACLKQLKDCYSFIKKFEDSQIWLQENFRQGIKEPAEQIIIKVEDIDENVSNESLDVDRNHLFLENELVCEYEDSALVSDEYTVDQTLPAKKQKTTVTKKVIKKRKPSRNLTRPQIPKGPIMMSIEDVLNESDEEHTTRLIDAADEKNNELQETTGDHTYQQNVETSPDSNRSSFIITVEDVLNSTKKTRKKKAKNLITQSSDLVEKHKRKKKRTRKGENEAEEEQLTFQCDICLKVYDSHRSLACHKRNMHIPDDLREKFKCTLCDVFCRTRSAFQHHQLKHKGKTYGCDLCGKLYLTPSKIKEHISRAHGEGLPATFLCTDCGLGFKFKTALKYHMISRHHKNNRPYMCRYCGFQCIQKSYLKRHERCHTDERPYQCKYCEKTFRGSGELRQHELNHEGKYRHSCRYCDKGFGSTWNMRVHTLQHGGDYICEICSRGFIEATVLNFHYFHHHKIRDDKEAGEDANSNDEQENLDKTFYSTQTEEDLFIQD